MKSGVLRDLLLEANEEDRGEDRGEESGERGVEPKSRETEGIKQGDQGKRKNKLRRRL